MTSPVTFAQPLSAEAMRRVLGGIMAGRTPPAEVRAFLTTLARRGETAEEIAAAVGVLRAHAVPLPLPAGLLLCDTCGTGGDGQGTINVSTLAALVAAASGVRIAKHGNRAAGSRCGSADLLEGLGVSLDATPEAIARSVQEAGFGFCFAPRFHPAMKAVAPIRQELKIRTLFNLIGPLANPAPLTFQLVGVADATLLVPMAEALVRLGIRHGLVVHGADGLDEATTTGETVCREVQAGRVSEEQRLDAARFGLPRASLDGVRGADVQTNVRIARDILEGHPGAASDIVALNAGCAIYVAGQARTIEEGIAKARAAVASGRAAEVLEQVKALSHAAG